MVGEEMVMVGKCRMYHHCCGTLAVGDVDEPAQFQEKALFLFSPRQVLEFRFQRKPSGGSQ